MAVFDLGETATWPAGFRDVVDEFASALRDHPALARNRFAADLGHHDAALSDRADRAIVDALGDDMFVAHHATRLMVHEVDAIREHGLRPAGTDLVDAKLSAARSAPGVELTASDLDVLRRSGPLRWQTGARRIGLAWVVAPMSVFESPGFIRLFRDWGGELLSFVDSADAAKVIERLRVHSRASIVDVAVSVADLDGSARRLWTTAVGVVLGLEEAHHEWPINGGVPSEQVLRIWHPDDADWPARYDYLRSGS